MKVRDTGEGREVGQAGCTREADCCWALGSIVKLAAGPGTANWDGSRDDKLLLLRLSLTSIPPWALVRLFGLWGGHALPGYAGGAPQARAQAILVPI